MAIRAPAPDLQPTRQEQNEKEQHDEAKADRPGIELQDSREQSANHVEHVFKSLRRSGLSARGQ